MGFLQTKLPLLTVVSRGRSAALLLNGIVFGQTIEENDIF